MRKRRRNPISAKFPAPVASSAPVGCEAQMTGPGPASTETGPRTGIAVLGGSFNPPHRSHVRLVREALASLPIGEVRVIPAGNHAHKQHRDMAPAEDRLAMCRLCFADIPGVVVDDRELRRAGPSFTVDTLAELAAEQPGQALFFLIGSDNLPLLPTWWEHHRLLRLATVVTFPRLGHPIVPAQLEGLDLNPEERRMLLAHVLTMPADGTAASTLRDRWRHGERHLPELPAPVARYLTDHQIYGP
jgi:nicotinate-nucleotide adenylyltransferase